MQVPIPDVTWLRREELLIDDSEMRAGSWKISRTWMPFESPTHEGIGGEGGGKPEELRGSTLTRLTEEKQGGLLWRVSGFRLSRLSRVL